MVADGVGLGTGVGGAVVGGLVECGVTVGSGVTVRCWDGVADGAGLRCGVRRGAGRVLDGDGEGEAELVC